MPLQTNYLGLVSARASAEERSRMGINYRHLAAQAHDPTTEEDIQ